MSLLLLFQTPPAAQAEVVQGDITFDAASNSGCQVAQSSYSWSHTVSAALSNRVLIVGVAMFSVPGAIVTGIQYAGADMHFVRDEVNGVMRTEIWALVNPSTGSNSVAVTLSTTLDSASGAASFGGVNQTSPIDADNGAVGNGNPASVSVTTLSDNTWLVDVISSADTTVTVDPNQSERWNLSCTLGASAGSTKGPLTPPGAYSMSWSGISALSAWSLTAVALLPFTAPVEGELFGLSIEDQLSAFDAFVKQQNAQMTEASFIADAFIKTHSSVMGDVLSQEDAFVKNLSVVRDDSLSVSDALTFLRYLLLNDSASVSDAQVKSILANMNDLAGSEDAFTKLLSVVKDESVDVSDAISLNRLLVLLLQENVDAFDVFVKTLANVVTDSGPLLDEMTKSLAVVRDDSVYVSDDLSISKVIALIILEFLDNLDVFDEFVKTVAKAMVDSAGVSDEQVKSLFATMEDRAANEDAFTKALAVVKSESLDVSDAFSLNRLLILLVQENQDAFDAFVKILAKVAAENADVSDERVTSRSAVMGDILDSGDAFTKNLAVVRTEQQDLSDQALIVKLLLLLVADSADVYDEQTKALFAQMAEAIGGSDAFVKNLSVNRDDSVAVSDELDIAKVIALILLELADLLDVADGFVKNVGKVDGDALPGEDAFTKNIQKVTTDSVAFSDTVSVNKAVSLAIDDLLSVLDGMTKLQASTMEEAALAGDEFTKTVGKVASELLDARDELVKIQGVTFADRLDVFDTVTLLRQLTLLVQDIANIADEMVKSRSANLNDDASPVDAFTKILLTTLQERIDLLDQAILSKFIVLILSEIQDVADDMVKAMATILDDSTVNQDALVKLLAKVISEQQDVSDSLLAEVVFAIIIYAEYLDSRLSGRHDLMGRLGGTNELTKKITKVMDPLGRKPGTKGHVR